MEMESTKSEPAEDLLSRAEDHQRVGGAETWTDLLAVIKQTWTASMAITK